MKAFIFYFSTACLMTCTMCEPKVHNSQFLGKIKTKAALEIADSDLWIGGEVLDRDLCSYDAYKSYLGELGAKKIRLQSGWAKTEKQPGVYDFDWLENIVDDAISRGVQPWIQISYGNPIYPGGGGVSLGQGLITSDEALDAFARYAEQLVGRFSDRVHEWEIWNEADLRHNSALGHDENTYAKLYIRTAESIRKIQPEAKLVALSIAGVGNTAFVNGFFDYLRDRDKLDLVDVVTFHGYPVNPDHNFDNVQKLVSAVRAYNTDIEFWQGETGCPSTFGSTGALSGHHWTEFTQAKWGARWALAHLGRGFKFSLFTISEFVYNDALRKGLNSKGILKIDETDYSILYPKQAFHMYQHLTSIFAGDLKLKNSTGIEIGSDSSVSVFCWQHMNGANLVAYWTDSSIPSDSVQEHRISLKLEDLAFEEPVLVDVLSGEAHTLPARQLSRKDGKTEIVDLKCHDAPLIIADKSLIEFE